MVYAHVPDAQRQKLGKKAVKLGFIGYSIQSKGSISDRLWNCTSSL